MFGNNRTADLIVNRDMPHFPNFTAIMDETRTNPHFHLKMDLRDALLLPLPSDFRSTFYDGLTFWNILFLCLFAVVFMLLGCFLFRLRNLCCPFSDQYVIRQRPTSPENRCFPRRFRRVAPGVAMRELPNVRHFVIDPDNMEVATPEASV